MIAAVIPVKRLSEAKSRLSSRLTSRERRELVIALLRRTIRVLQEVEAIERIGVATAERGLVQSFNTVDWLPEVGGLNPSLAHATKWAADMDAQSMLILPCDLPFLDPSDVRALLAARPAVRSITISPTQDGGTGAIMLSPPDVISPAFGLDSFKRHIEEAHAARIVVTTVLRPGFARDLDTTEDLKDLEATEPDFDCITT
jgi:2-phospho-L-lactate/phosphoenolpyruvate guanylyltransferase